MCDCMHVCVCVAKPVAVELHCHASALIFSFMDSFVFKQQVLFRVDFLSVTLDHTGLRPIYVIFFEFLPISFQMKNNDDMRL